MYKTIPKKNKCKKAKWLFDKALQRAEKRSERQRRKGKIYPFDAEFQRITRRDKKDFLSEQYKETEENNRMGKTRDLLKKITDTKRMFHEKMGTISVLKDRSKKY